MQVDNRNNYNTLGRMGPIYPRQEFRPPQKNLTENSEDPKGLKGDAPGKKTQKEDSESLILSDKLKRKSAAKSAPERINLQEAKALVTITGEDISALDPKSDYGCPHNGVEGFGLLYPTYA
ncbi:MAG: hypothetical protein LBE38_01730 [Deltaproteobacteria bacterium]|jgi:hypothetical protein|nr:hypothetical protein [Deltaproteobacteria bacterium]